jgi:3D (Asp-Asp-Asp) domain-containing protein
MRLLFRIAAEATDAMDLHMPSVDHGNWTMRSAACAAALLCSVGLPACGEDDTNAKTTQTYELTYYWLVTPEDADLTTPLVDVLDIDDNLIAQAPEDLVEQIALEGSGYLPDPDGRLINLACSCPWPDSRFEVVDTDVAPWGIDARGEPLEPVRTLAVDTDLIDLGDDVYLADFDGLELEDGTIHDGCFVAGDTGYGIIGKHIDLFAGTQSNYVYLDEALDQETETPVKVVKGCP